LLTKMSKQRRITTAVLITLVFLSGIVFFRWGARYGNQNAWDIERAKASIERGRGYEVLVEDTVFLTDDEHYSDLLYFLEGHYEVRLEHFEEDTVILDGHGGHMVFHLTDIVSFRRRYLIWEREN